jgi:hypothetical protein
MSLSSVLIQSVRVLISVPESNRQTWRSQKVTKTVSVEERCSSLERNMKMVTCSYAFQVLSQDFGYLLHL